MKRVIAFMLIIGAGVWLGAWSWNRRPGNLDEHNRRNVEEFQRIVKQYPVTSPADVGGDVEYFNELVRLGQAVPATQPLQPQP
jgi:hypothetical protein